MSPKKHQINVAIDPPEWKALEKFEKQTGIPKVTLSRVALYAAVREWQRTGSITLPLSVSFRPDNESVEAALSAANRTKDSAGKARKRSRARNTRDRQ